MSPKEELRREEVQGKTRRDELQGKVVSEPLPRLLKKMTYRSFIEITKIKKKNARDGVCIEVGEEEGRERLDQLNRCLVGWWGKCPTLIPEVDFIQKWAIARWEVKDIFNVVRFGRGLLLLVFEIPKEADRVLFSGKRRCGGNLLHLRKWGHDIVCLSHGDLEEKAWVRVVGFLVHLLWARILVSLGDETPPNTIEVVVGGWVQLLHATVVGD